MYFPEPNPAVDPRAGDLLISEPFLSDPNFERTVIYLCEHSKEGSVGFVLNNKTDASLREVWDGVLRDGFPLFTGGPVAQDSIHFLHRLPVLAEDSVPLDAGIYWGRDFEQAIHMINAGDLLPQDIRFFLGYAGWAAGQLKNELTAKTWIVLKAPTQEMIFDWDNQALWKACLQRMGGKYRLMSNHPKDPRLN